MLLQMFSSTSWSSRWQSLRSSSQDVLPPVPAVQTDDFQGFPGCVFRRPDGVRAVVPDQHLCLRLARDGRGRYCSTIGTTFPLQLPGDHEFEHVRAALQLCQRHGEVQPVFEM